jgi:uncharacterized RmlC-like cupin family protein
VSTVERREFLKGAATVAATTTASLAGTGDRDREPLIGQPDADRSIPMNDSHEHKHVDWKRHGVKVIPGHQLDPNTAATPGMDRAAAINFARVGAQKIWAGTVKIHANAKTGAHHHGPLESVIYVLQGRARMRWGEHLEYVAEADPGDFIFVPPFVPHQEINASASETLECILVRSDNEAVVVNLDIEPVEPPEEVRWIDSIHRPV